MTKLAVGTLRATPYMVQMLVPGINGAEAHGQHEYLWQELGRYSKLIHSIKVAGFGDRLSDGEQGIFGNVATDTWLRFVNYNIESLVPTDELIKLGVYTPGQRQLIQETFEALRERPFQYGLNHGDISPRNTIIDPAGKVSLLDWGCAEVHIVPHYEFAEMLGEDRPEDKSLQAFLYGYGISPSEFATILPDVESLQLLKAFDLVRWAIDQRPQEVPTYVMHARQILRQRTTCQ